MKEDPTISNAVTDKGNTLWLCVVSDDDIQILIYPEHFTAIFHRGGGKVSASVTGAMPISPMPASYVGTLHSTLNSILKPKASSLA